MTKVKNYNLIAFLVLVTILFTVAADRSYAKEADEDIWRDEPEIELTKEKIDRIMTKLAEEHPERAQRLQRLREEDRKEFREEIRNIVQNRYGRHHGKGKMAPYRSKSGMKDKPCPLGMEPGGENKPCPLGMEPDRDGRGRRPESVRGKELSHEKPKEFVEWLKKNYPDQAAELEKLRQKDGEGFIEWAALSRKKYGPIMKAEKYNPELAQVLKEDLELKNRRNELLEEIRSASGKELEELTEELTDVVSERFDLIVRKREFRCKSMLKRLEKLEIKVQQREAEIDKLRDKKGQAVEERIKELVGKTEKINWD